MDAVDDIAGVERICFARTGPSAANVDCSDSTPWNEHHGGACLPTGRAALGVADPYAIDICQRTEW